MTLPPPFSHGSETSAKASPARQGMRAAETRAPEISEDEFQAILTVIAGSKRGRSFLAEYHRRAQQTSTAVSRPEPFADGMEAARAQLRVQSERAAAVVRRLTCAIEELRPLGAPSVRAVAADAREAVLRGRPGGLERRFAALVELDERDLERGLKLFG